MIKMYEFFEQREKGKTAEKQLDAFFSKWYQIKTITVDDELKDHYDRIFTRGDIETTVEYKTDFKAHETRNAFIELTSCKEKNTMGWIHTSKADRLIYFVPETKEVYIVKLMYLRMATPYYSKKFGIRTCTNKRKDGIIYHSEGFLMPLQILGTLGKVVLLK